MGTLKLAMPALATILLGLLATPGVARADSGVWVLEGKSNRVYIAGSIHMLRPNGNALPAALEAAYADAEKLVFELDLDDLNQMLVAGEMMTAGTRQDGQTLSGSMPVALAGRLNKSAETLGLPAAMLDTMEPWLAALVMTSVSLVKQGYSAEAGVDQQLTTRARKDRKPVAGLETPAEQFDAFDTLSDATQLRLLEMTFDELENGGADLRDIEAAWRSGDMRELARVLQDDMAKFPELERAILFERNRRWVPRIQRMLHGKDDVLVVVGAAHLLGDQGVIALFRAAGEKPRALPAVSQAP
jgi:uncharacterized protein YbaP (TraB family)